MITPEDQPPPAGAASDQQSSRPMGVAPDDGRMTLEELARVLPIRNIWGLFRAYRGDAASMAGLAALDLDQFNANARPADPGADPATAARPSAPAWKPAPLSDDADEATRAAYNVANQQFQAGEAVAKELAQTAMLARAQDVPTLLNRLLETYSDLGSVFVQLIGAALAREQAQPQSTPQAGAEAPAPQTSPAIAVEVTAACPVTARALLYAPLGAAPLALQMVRIGGEGLLPAPEIRPGPVIHVTIPQYAAPGEYHGVILAEAGGAPAGTATVTIPAPA